MANLSSARSRLTSDHCGLALRTRWRRSSDSCSKRSWASFSLAVLSWSTSTPQLMAFAMESRNCCQVWTEAPWTACRKSLCASSLRWVSIRRLADSRAQAFASAMSKTESCTALCTKVSKSVSVRHMSIAFLYCPRRNTRLAAKTNSSLTFTSTATHNVRCKAMMLWGLGCELTKSTRRCNRIGARWRRNASVVAQVPKAVHNFSWWTTSHAKSMMAPHVRCTASTSRNVAIGRQAEAALTAAKRSR
mmetsp:Transcript_97207/g.279830  ORF Transcript_97207/g.279830 Transcript_97207/m.279830 type:complete len:247 (-) Transcript_97207:210-950(-)